MSRYARHKTIGVEHIMRECKESDNIWYEKIKESNVYWKISFNCTLISIFINNIFYKRL